MLLLFQRFERLGEWTVDEVMLCFACIHLSFALSECLARGFDMFSHLVSQGEFDRVLVRPRNTVLQVLGARFEFSRIGRFALSLTILVVALVRLPLELTLLKGLTLLLMVVCGALIFSGIFMLSATLCFWTIQGIEVANILTDGGREMAQYPLSIYPKGFMRFFTFVVPFGTVNYLPLRWLLDRPDSQPWHALTPLLGLLFLVPCVLLWRFGVRKYQSAGS
jgi:ABC-2 type transport system permease protein